MNFNKMSKKELIDYIKTNHNISYGITWDDELEQEEIVINCEKYNSILKEIPEKSINNGGVSHLLIEGDNYQSLICLLKQYKEKIDLIYIDPPYNTENQAFIYNDKYINKKDKYKHSKWLNFMERRLSIAKNLLKETGIIYISIGDDELAQLKLLCDKIFKEKNYISTITRIMKRTSNKGNFFKPTKDYILVYVKNKKKINWKFGTKSSINEKEYKYKDKYGLYKKNGASLYQPSLDARPNQRYYIECPDKSLIIPPGNIFPKEKKDASLVKPKSNEDKCWRWSVDTYLKNKDKLIFTKASSKCPLIDSNGNKSKWNIYDKVYLDNKKEKITLPEDIIYDYLNSQGTKELQNLGFNFSFAKPTGLIKYLIKISNLPKDITILDFFAGSGTTAQAVLELNKEDNGKRKFILCTNNENNICESITYPRCKTIITGKRIDNTTYSKNIKATLKYYKTEFTKKERNKSMV